MLEKIEFSYILLPLFIIFGVVLLVFRNRMTKIVLLKIRIVMFVVILIALWFSLPITPSLSTFGRPQDLTDMTPEKMLKYLQRYNDAIVRTTEVVHWLIFAMAVFFVGTVYDLIKYVDSNTTTTTNEEV